MNSPPDIKASDWSRIKLVAFDVDGTLYNQHAMQLYMMRDLMVHTIATRSLNVLSVLRSYRRIRERMGGEETRNFEAVLVAETAKAVGCTEAIVRNIVADWMEKRPLPYLARCMYQGLPDLFAGLKRNGKTVAILSDYPAQEKLAAMGLAADHVICSGDKEVGYLKPHPRGFERLLQAANVRADQAVLIGNRPERDGLAALRVGAKALIYSYKPISGWQTFSSYGAPLFAPLLLQK
ncbi:MAG: HAD family hydrolase [Betaproteobacteria bacterium]|nr:HAD family hydrolase [Betaproteobacteria bacterium]